MTSLYNAQHLAKVLQTTALDTYSHLKGVDPASVVFVGILTNGVFFAKRIHQKLTQLAFTIPSPVMSLDISLYRDDLANQHDYITMGASQLQGDINNRHVVLFDDVLSTGRTARAALNAIFDYGRPSRVSFVVLFDRPHREVPIQPDVVGQVVDVPVFKRVNVTFLEVTGDDGVMVGPMAHA